MEDPNVIRWMLGAVNSAPAPLCETAGVACSFAAGGEAEQLPDWAATVADHILVGLRAMGQTAADVAQWLTQVVKHFLGAVGKSVIGVLESLLGAMDQEQPLHGQGLTQAAVRTVALIVLIAVVQHKRPRAN